MKRLADLLAPTLKRPRLAPAELLWRVRDLWAVAVGPRIAARSTPVGLSRGELVVSVPEAVWRQELSLMAPELIPAVNQALAEPIVKRIRWIGSHFGAIPERPASVARPGATPPSQQRKPSLLVPPLSSAVYRDPRSADPVTEVIAALESLERRFRKPTGSRSRAPRRGSR